MLILHAVSAAAYDQNHTTSEGLDFQRTNKDASWLLTHHDMPQSECNPFILNNDPFILNNIILGYLQSGCSVYKCNNYLNLY